MSDESEFLSRWSKKKLSDKEMDADTDGDTGLAASKSAALGEDIQPSDAPALPEHDEETDDEQEVPPALADIDIDSLDYDSDYTMFMKENVPEALKRRALRQLWRSNPVLANVDGLNDYDDDFTDAALVVKGMQSAYKIGKGYLTDEDLEEDLEDGVEEDAEELVSEADTSQDGDRDGEDDAQSEGDDPATESAVAEDTPGDSGPADKAHAGMDGEHDIDDTQTG